VPSSLFADAHRKLVAGTEVLRTGGGATLTSSECNALIDYLADQQSAIFLLRSFVSLTLEEDEKWREQAREVLRRAE
jgi:hypothetical protein